MARFTYISQRNGLYEIEVPNFLVKDQGDTALTLYSAGWNLHDLIQDAEFHASDMEGSSWTEPVNQHPQVIDKIQELWNEYHSVKAKTIKRPTTSQSLPRGRV